jgi:hypothetical protein
MEELLHQAEQALEKKDGQQALTLVNQILEEDEKNVAAWLIAMKSFQLILPIEKYQSENELECARAAIASAKKEEKYRVRKQVYLFLMTKILDVLKRDVEVLGDGRDLISFYQRTVYFDAAGAAQKTADKDQELREAVMATFAYCKELFEYIPDSFLKKNVACNRKAAEVATQWVRTYNFLEMRFEFYHRTMSKEYVIEGLQQYARYLRAVRGKEEILAREVPFNIYHLNQLPYLQ